MGGTICGSQDAGPHVVARTEASVWEAVQLEETGHVLAARVESAPEDCKASQLAVKADAV